MRSREPKATALIFSSGKMIVTGARSEEICKTAARNFMKSINKITGDLKFKNFKVHNVVASLDSGFRISLEKMSNDEKVKK